MFRYDNKIVVVTGCGSIAKGIGNGRAMAMAFARQGAKVIGTDRNHDAAKETADMVRAEGGQIEVAALDSLDDAALTDFFQELLKREERVDVLVNNIGQSEPGGPYDMALETWRGQFALNIDTAFMAIKQVLPGMRARRNGAIINVSSVAGMRYIGKPQVGYAAAKAALVQMTKTTAIIEAPHNVRLNCVVPGLMHTPLVEMLAQKYAGGDTEAFVAKRHQQVPLGRMGDAWDVAHAAIYLGSDEASYVTGAELVVDGGITATTP
jgi:Dehydrogenases with different specificities (related to short-chain alcohol dehydrogenases)